MPPPPPPLNVTVNISSLLLSLGDNYNVKTTNVDFSKLRKIVSDVNSDSKLEKNSEANVFDSQTLDFSDDDAAVPAGQNLTLDNKIKSDSKLNTFNSQNLDFPERPNINVTVNISSMVLSLGDNYNVETTNVDLSKLRKIVSSINSDNKIESNSETNIFDSQNLSLHDDNVVISDNKTLNGVDMNNNQHEEKKLRIVLLGKPGSGKGTHGAWISKQKNIPIISTGDEIRALIKSTSEETKDLRTKLLSYTSAGKLVPDDLVIDILKERISKPDCSNGYILDGFPRTIEQAKALDEIGEPIDFVIHMQIDNSVIERRMTGRRSCPTCGRVYNVNSSELKPKVEGKCDDCDSDLIQRDDDKPETVKNRLEVYENQTAPLVDYYSKTGKLQSINVDGPREEVTNSILEMVNKNVASKS